MLSNYLPTRDGIRTTLLHDVAQLMRQQPLAPLCLWRVPARAKDDVTPDGISQSIDCTRRFGGFRIAMHAYSAKIVAEASLHQVACFRVKWPARRLYDLVHNGRYFRRMRARL